jgi:hypothetical protein
MGSDFVLNDAGANTAKGILEAVATFHLVQNQVSHLAIRAISADTA